MIRLSEIPVILYLVFMLIYFAAGTNNSPVWSGLFFCFHYVAIGAASIRFKSKIIKGVLLCMSFTMFTYSALKYVLGLEFERWFVNILLLLCIFGFYKLQNTK